jgi:hypothetical protein
MPGKVLIANELPLLRSSLRSAHTPARPELESQKNRHGKLEPKRGAAEGSRKENRRREGVRNLRYLKDFEEREPPRATAQFLKVERRSHWRRRWCRRRTSLRAKPPDAVSIAQSRNAPLSPVSKGQLSLVPQPLNSGHQKQERAATDVTYDSMLPAGFGLGSRLTSYAVCLLAGARNGRRTKLRTAGGEL